MKLTEIGNRFAKQSSWKDFALTKLCLCALGVIIGVLLPESAKDAALIAAGVIFACTFIPLMAKTIGIIRDMMGK